MEQCLIYCYNQCKIDQRMVPNIMGIYLIFMSIFHIIVIIHQSYGLSDYVWMVLFIYTSLISWWLLISICWSRLVWLCDYRIRNIYRHRPLIKKSKDHLFPLQQLLLLRVNAFFYIRSLSYSPTSFPLQCLLQLLCQFSFSWSSNLFLFL